MCVRCVVPTDKKKEEQRKKEEKKKREARELTDIEVCVQTSMHA